MILDNIKNEDLIRKAKEKVLKKKNQVKTRVKKMNPQNKVIMKLQKKVVKYQRKAIYDFEEITEILKQLEPGYEIKIVSNKIDSPNILKAVVENYPVKKIYISTWAITDIAFTRIKELCDQGVQFKIMLDIIHSYKWLHKSGALDLVKENCEFIFTENHSKFQLFELENSQVINFVGSFNFTNNPRYENMTISTCIEDFNFYKTCLEEIGEGINEIQKTLL